MSPTLQTVAGYLLGAEFVNLLNGMEMGVDQDNAESDGVEALRAQLTQVMLTDMIPMCERRCELQVQVELMAWKLVLAKRPRQVLMEVAMLRSQFQEAVRQRDQFEVMVIDMLPLCERGCELQEQADL